jgi:Tfp pilus assembly protein PilF
MTVLYMARAELALGELEAARTRLTSLVGEDPSLLAAQTTLAVVMKKRGLTAQANEELKKVIKADSDYTPAKRALVE